MRFWLIQRGEFNKYNESIENLTGRNGLIDLDYMGSSEFEWGAIPKAYRRIMGEFEQYKLFRTDIINRDNLPLNIFCRKDRIDEITNALKEFIAEPYQLQEYCEIDKWCRQPIYFEGTKKEFLPPRSDFWWEIENGKDFMCFFAKGGRIAQFKYIIKNAYENWWMKKDEETRKKDLAESFNSI